LNSW